jgi:CelD/BcsL family acetyltransferase involved in cellulose biosynthesis
MYETRIISSFEGFKASRIYWNNVLDGSKSDTVFLTHEWLSAWIRTNKLNEELFIIIISESDTVCAIAPLFISKESELGIPIKKLQFIGSPHADYSDFIISRNINQCVKNIFYCIIMHRNRWDIIDLSHISDLSLNLPEIEKHIKLHDLLLVKREKTASPYVEIPDSFETYYVNISKKLRYDIRRNEKRLSSIGALNYEIVEKEVDRMKILPHFIETLKGRSKDAGRPGEEISYNLFFNLFEAFITCPRASKLISFSKHTLNSEAIAYHFGFIYKKSMYWYKPTFNISFSSFSTGSIHLMRSMEYASNNGINEIDLLLGDEGYKKRWSTNERSVLNMTVYQKTLKSLLLKAWIVGLKPILRQNNILANIIGRYRKMDQ